MDWITEQIAIGNYLDALEMPPGIEAILCLKPQCCDEGREDVAVLCIPLADGPGNRREDVIAAVDYIHDVVSAGERVLVHCHAGRSRSVCIVAAYFMRYEGLSRTHALATIEAKRETWLTSGIEDLFRFVG